MYSFTNFVSAAIVSLLILGAVAGCGLRGNPLPPAGVEITWPRQYPPPLAPAELPTTGSPQPASSLIENDKK